MDTPDYSQFGEQRVFEKYFGAFKGTLLDIGANDGSTLSNSRALIAHHGWKAVLVEPSPSAFTRLASTYLEYPDVILINAAVTDRDGQTDFWDCGVHLHKGDTALLSTAVAGELNRWKRSGEQFSKTTCRGITFASLVNECRRSHFDFITIDAEGMDYAILSQINLTGVGCRCLCVETNGKEEQKFIDYCARFGMKVIHRNAVNLVMGR